MRIRCPHCHDPIDVLDDDPLAEIKCSSCGSNFSLIGDTATESYRPAGPRRIAHFELLDQVGVGSFGSVWKARDTILQRIVALKIPRISQLSPADVDFFFRGARAAAQLRHASIVSVHEVGRDDQTVFIATDFIDGANLKEWLSAGGLTFREAAELLFKVADAVHHAHEHGVVHRDLKPANILIDVHGEPHVADFGLAKRETGEVSVTTEGQLIGTAQYMSPEQAAGKGHHADARSDVYSLGVILFELLTGELPFRGEKRMLLLQIVHDEPPRLRKFNARVPRDLETICLKCLEKDPRRRYDTAQGLADDLRRFLHQQPIHARPVGRVNRAWRWAKRNPMVASLSGLLLAMLMGVAIVGPAVAIQQAKLRLAAGDALNEQEKATGAAERAEAKRADQLWRSLMNQARANRTSGRPGRRFKSLELLAQGLAIVRQRAVPNNDYLLDFRNEAVAALAMSDLDIGERWQSIPTDESEQDRQLVKLNVDAKLERYLRSDAKGNISVRRISDDTELLSLPGAELPVLATVFSPDGRFLAVRYGISRDNERRVFKVWDLNDGKVHLTAPFTVRNEAFDFSKDGRQLAVGTHDADVDGAEPSSGHTGSIYVYDLARPAVPTHQFASNMPAQIAFHPDGRKIAVTSDTSNVVDIHDLATGKTLEPLPHECVTLGVDWSPDGKLLAVGCRWEIFVWDVERRQHFGLPGHLNQVTHVTFSHRGDLLASRSWDYTIRLWDITARRQLISAPGGLDWTPLTFSEDDSRLAFVRDGSQMALLKVADGRELQRLDTHEAQHELASNSDSPYRAMDFSHDGRWLVVGGDESVSLWDLSKHTKAASLPILLSRMSYQQPVKIAFGKEDFELLTASRSGLQRWPFAIDAPKSRLHIGPPQIINDRILNFFSASREHILGVTRSDEDVIVLDRMSGAAKVTVSHPTLTTAVIGPHGQWFATAAWKEPDVRIWNASTGELLRTLPAVSPACISLSPDGQLLVVGMPDKLRGVDTRLWQTRFEIPRTHAGGAAGHSVFRDDGNLFALNSSFTTLQLIDSKKGQPIAELQPPHEERLGYFCFSHDGGRLAVRYGTTSAVEIWDLRLIRQQLDELGLDWDLPKYPPPAEEQFAPITEVSVVAGEGQGEAETTQATGDADGRR